MENHHDLDTVLADTHFQRLLRETSRRSIPWDEFLGMPQPTGMSPLESWRVLGLISRYSSVSHPIPDYSDQPYWYRRTNELDDEACRVSCACQSESHLHQITSAAEGQHFLVRLRLEEVIAAAELDGLSLDPGDAEELLRLSRKPQTPAEQLLRNNFDVMDRLPDLAKEPFSVDLFLHLHSLLAQDVDIACLEFGTPGRGILIRLEDDNVDAQRQYAQRQLNFIAAFLDNETSDPDDLAILRGEMAADAMRFYHSLGPLSSQVGRLTSKLSALKNGFPVLALLPLSRLKRDWDLGTIKPPAVAFDRDSYDKTNERSPFDLTAAVTLTIQLMSVAVRRLSARVEEWERRDEEMRSILYDDPLLNQRQRSILGRALRSPDAEFRIRYHQKNHGIHYTTARRDLLELHEKEYLVMRQVGQAFVFRRGPRLDQLERNRMG